MMPDSQSQQFRIAFSADFLDEHGKLIFPDIGLSVLDSLPNLSYEFMQAYRPEYDPEQFRDYDVVISLKPRVTAASLQGIDRLCAIGRCGVGYDNVDLAACTEKDIAVFITPTAVVRPVAESIVLFVLALSHNLVWKDRLIREGHWQESTRRLGREPRDRVIGTVGLGNIASDAIRLLRQFSVARFLAFDPYAPPARATALGVDLVPLDDLLRQSDYVLINCPLTTETRRLIGERELALMKPDAFLINTARGAILDEAALVRVLENRAIAGAALDVFEKEPLEPSSPLLRLDNVILTSHSVAWTRELFRDMGRMDCEGALAVYRGEPPANVVNRDVLERPGFQRKLQRHRENAGRTRG
ncbi:MAG TPA: NAD(P)-dependent oxidoreductase [Bryobacteraceae bacterium]|nr:NAD(P)-dependent oxidoreductase [Bryobacteraceae bacterium]